MNELNPIPHLPLLSVSPPNTHTYEKKKKKQHKTPQPNLRHPTSDKELRWGGRWPHWALSERGSSPALGADSSPFTTSCSHSAPLTSAAAEISLLCLQPADWEGVCVLGVEDRTCPPPHFPLGQ